MDKTLAEPERHDRGSRTSRDCDLVVEAIAENVGSQDASCSARSTASCKPDAIFASNTSSLSITEMRHLHASGPERFIGLHFFNPVPLMKLVEVVRTLRRPSDGAPPHANAVVHGDRQDGGELRRLDRASS